MSTAAQERPLLSISAVADRTGVSASTIRRRIAEGDLPAVKLGHLIRVDPDDLDAWLAKHLIEGSCE